MEKKDKPGKFLKVLKKIGSVILDIIELYIPSITFILLFLVFVLQIICRYFFVPLTWPIEFVGLCFVWIALLGGLYAKRKKAHVAFTVIYDSLKPKTQIIISLIGNILMLTAFIISLYPTYDYVNFMSFDKSNVLKIPMHWAFSPFLVFLVIIIGRIAVDVYIDFRKLLRKDY
jgi:TRAP-type C4-dicarboxylate transport system permease small subunit